MAANATHPNFKAVVTTYALGIGQTTCLDCAAGFPTVIQDIAASQDKIRWGNFIMGMISLKLIFHPRISSLALHSIPIG
jgi:hypothetical protein